MEGQLLATADAHFAGCHKMLSHIDTLAAFLGATTTMGNDHTDPDGTTHGAVQAEAKAAAATAAWATAAREAEKAAMAQESELAARLVEEIEARRVAEESRRKIETATAEAVEALQSPAAQPSRFTVASRAAAAVASPRDAVGRNTRASPSLSPQANRPSPSKISHDHSHVQSATEVRTVSMRQLLHAESESEKEDEEDSKEDYEDANDDVVSLQTTML